MKRVLLWSVLGVALFLGLWSLQYRDGDPKSIAYIGWEANLLPMEPLKALSIMTHGPNSDRLVLGKTKPQLQQRFGYVLTADQVGPYLRNYCAASRPGANVLFLNSSNFMVVMNNKRAVELVLCKG
jgi:hypothetical protein